MNNKLYLSSIAAIFAITSPIIVSAASPLSLQKTSLQNLQNEFYITTSASTSKSMNDDPVNTLSLLQSHKDKYQVNHIRVQQNYAGFPVDGGDGVLHSDSSVKTILAKNTKVQMNGTLYLGLSDELGQPPVQFIANGALVLERFKKPFQGQKLSDELVEPIVYIDDENRAHWAYRVAILVTHKDAIPERPMAIIDANTQKKLIEWNDIKTDRIASLGIGFGGNEKTGRFTYGMPEESGSLPYLKISRTHSGRNGITCYMENKDVQIVDMKSRYSTKNETMKFPCNPAVSEKKPQIFWTGYHGDGFDESNGAYSPSNDALYAGDVIKRMYLEWYQTEALIKPDSTPMQLIMRVHYGTSYANAFWYENQMTFGDGDLPNRNDSDSNRSTFKMHPLVSLGIAAHEVSHGFTEQHSNLRYVGQSGGMNESFSDMAAQTAEMFGLGKNTWMLGGEVMKSSSKRQILRFMDVPSKDGKSIDTAKGYYEGLNPHYSSGVYNRLFYLLSNEADWDIRKAFEVMVEANKHYWVPRSTYIQGACGILSAAKGLKYETDAIKRSLDTVAIDYQNCT